MENNTPIGQAYLIYVDDRISVVNWETSLLYPTRISDVELLDKLNDCKSDNDRGQLILSSLFEKLNQIELMDQTKFKIDIEATPIKPMEDNSRFKVQNIIFKVKKI